MKWNILAPLAVASLAMVAGPLPLTAKVLDKQPAAEKLSCDNFAELSQAQQLELLNQAVASGAVTGWPGPDTICMGGSELQAGLPAPTVKKKHQAVTE